MNEQAFSVLLGSLGTALVTSVGALAYTVRQHRRNGVGNGLGSIITNLNTTLIKQTEVLVELTKGTELHNREAGLRHDAMVKALDIIQRHNERER